MECQEAYVDVFDVTGYNVPGAGGSFQFGWGRMNDGAMRTRPSRPCSVWLKEYCGVDCTKLKSGS